MFTGRNKKIRIIGDPDKQLPDKWSSDVLSLTHNYAEFYFLEHRQCVFNGMSHCNVVQIDDDDVGQIVIFYGPYFKHHACHLYYVTRNVFGRVLIQICQ